MKDIALKSLVILPIIAFVDYIIMIVFFIPYFCRKLWTSRALLDNINTRNTLAYWGNCKEN